MNRPITGNYLAVRFWISSIETNWGESIHVLGELPELGSWRPDEGNKMSLFRVDGWMLKKKLSSVVHFMKVRFSL